MSEPIEDYAKRQAAEYGQYVANGPIYIDGALAFTADQPVPASHVERYNFLTDGYVRPAGTAPIAPPPPPPIPVGEPIIVDADSNGAEDNDPAGAVQDDVDPTEKKD